MATPESLPTDVPRFLDRWSMMVVLCDGVWTPFFDTERVVIYRSDADFPWMASDKCSLEDSAFAGQPGIDAYLHLGPGWEGHAVDLYWGLCRAAIRAAKDEDPMLAMVYEAALVGSK